MIKKNILLPLLLTLLSSSTFSDSTTKILVIDNFDSHYITYEYSDSRDAQVLAFAIGLAAGVGHASYGIISSELEIPKQWKDLGLYFHKKIKSLLLKDYPNASITFTKNKGDVFATTKISHSHKESLYDQIYILENKLSRRKEKLPSATISNNINMYGAITAISTNFTLDRININNNNKRTKKYTTYYTFTAYNDFLKCIPTSPHEKEQHTLEYQQDFEKNGYSEEELAFDETLDNTHIVSIAERILVARLNPDRVKNYDEGTHSCIKGYLINTIRNSKVQNLEPIIDEDDSEEERS
jgi:hypothetical protein